MLESNDNKPRRSKKSESRTPAEKPAARKRSPRKKTTPLGSVATPAGAPTAPAAAAASMKSSADAPFAVREAAIPAAAPAARAIDMRAARASETSARPSVAVASVSMSAPPAAQASARSQVEGAAAVRAITAHVKDEATSVTGHAHAPRAEHGWVTAEERHRLISLKAYAIAERRGFGNGHPEQDWLEAEREIDAMLLKVQQI